MTAIPAVRRLPDEVSVVEVYGSKFLLEWLDLGVLASAAAHQLASGLDASPGARRAAWDGGQAPRGRLPARQTVSGTRRWASTRS